MGRAEVTNDSLKIWGETDSSVIFGNGSPYVREHNAVRLSKVKFSYIVLICLPQ